MEHKPSFFCEGLFVMGKFSKKDGKFEKKKGKCQHKSYGGDTSAIRCYHYKKKDQTGKVFYDRQNNHGVKHNCNAIIVQVDFESYDVLVVLSINTCKELIMDSSCTWNMTPNKD